MLRQFPDNSFGRQLENCKRLLRLPLKIKLLLSLLVLGLLHFTENRSIESKVKTSYVHLSILYCFQKSHRDFLFFFTLPCFSALYCSSRALTDSLRGPGQENEGKKTVIWDLILTPLLRFFLYLDYEPISTDIGRYTTSYVAA